ncbi:hypothetical protein MOV08_00295 [Streptomyces yunnanensis]|uniref:Polyketide synthase dehydratase domain-containing protein n=1 Tax=Streptomyces yunnanensis TaxID=156453 RepID=A0ABY8AKT6_9ACTN|nr:hypothetical protein MOV08_00295 [Streptomyces yunnanensis]
MTLAETNETLFTTRLSLTTHPWLTHHTLSNTTTLTPATLTELAIRAGDHHGATTLDHLTLHTPSPSPTPSHPTPSPHHHPRPHQPPQPHHPHPTRQQRHTLDLPRTRPTLLFRSRGCARARPVAATGGRGHRPRTDRVAAGRRSLLRGPAERETDRPLR